MKKFLSLVLALVMTMSLVTVSAGAKDFTDSSKITYSEAVDVMSAVKVIDGYAEGDFRPTATLTRGAAAKIICNLILGPTTAGALVADAAPYKDVPTNHTFAGYIAYCQKEGIISGYADGTFKPAATLTGYAKGSPFMMNIAGKAENTLVKVESDFFHNFIVELVAFLRTGEIHVPHDQTLAIMAVRGAGLEAIQKPGVWVDVPAIS
mgnify:CR=1 FL=1